MKKTTKSSVEGKSYEVPIEGSLGLLALGAVGLKAWRKKRDESQKSSPSKNKLKKG